MAKDNDDWPDIIYEREPETDVERIEEGFRADGINIKSKLEGEITADLNPGERLQLHWHELEIEMGARGIATLFVENEPIWSGPISEIEHLHTYSSSIEKKLVGVAINGKVVWIRPIDE